MEQKIYTSCTLDCPDGCGIIAHVKDGRVVKLEGHPDHEFTQGYLCGKTYRFPERVYSPERQLHPLKRSNGRTDGGWERISGTRRSTWWRTRSAATWPTRARCPSCTTSAPAPGAPPSS